MAFFETPSWDGDHRADKLTDELFHRFTVPIVKFSKKKKKIKCPKDSVTDDVTKILKSPKGGKDQTAKVKKNKLSNKIPKQRERQIKSKNEVVDKIKCSSSQSSNGGDVIHSNSLSNSILSSAVPSSPPEKRKKKTKKQKHINGEGELKEAMGGHKLKSLKDKLDLNIIVKPPNVESNGDKITATEGPKQKKLGNKFMKKQIQEISSHAMKNLKRKASVNFDNDQQPSKRLLSYEGEKNEVNASLKEKVKVKGVSHLSQNINLKKRNRTSIGETSNIQSFSTFSKNIMLNDASKSEPSKKKRKNPSKACGNGGVMEMETCSSTPENPRAMLSMKKKHYVDHENVQKRNKKKKGKGDETESQSVRISNELPLNSNRVLQQVGELNHLGGSQNSYNAQNSGASTSPKKKLTLREKMLEKLRGSRFRFLNEQLYSSKSEETKKFFESDLESFEAYHEGYKQQLLQWPVKPVDLIIQYLKKKPPNYIIADFGCGDAQIAQSLPNKVHSFDFVAINDHVTACDMANAPLSNGSVDVAVFCLSLMGSNLSDYIYEANRVLKVGGVLKIAEVESRFDNVEKFIRAICKFGFLCISRDLSRDVFYLFDFKKEKNLKNGKNLPPIELRACFYKKR